jgi:RecJ-like exonuclease
VEGAAMRVSNEIERAIKHLNAGAAVGDKTDCQNEIARVIDDMRKAAAGKDLPIKKIIVMINDFLDTKDGFFNWDNSARISEELTYRTFQRTLFKRYKGSRYGLYASIE